MSEKERENDVFIIFKLKKSQQKYVLLELHI